MWWRTTARKQMLMRLERGVITDSMLKIQSAQAPLKEVDGSKFVSFDEIHSCLKSADKKFRAGLRSNPLQKKR
jgi:hypothetical protein